MPLKKKSLASQPNSIGKALANEKPQFGNLSDVQAADPDWFWYPLILFSAITIIEGDPGIGKSFLMMYLTALVSSGGLLPDGARVRRGRVLYLSAEDDPAFTIKPRILMMEGDPARIRYCMKYLALDDVGFQRLKDEISEFRPDLVVIDPLYGFVGGGIDVHRPNEIREVLSQLNDIAQDCGAAIVIVRHLRKGSGSKALYQGAGSIDVIGAARSAILVAIDPEDDDLRAVAHLKHNLSPRGDTWMFELVCSEKGKLPQLEWRGTSELTADDLTNTKPADKSAREEAADFLREALSEGPRAQQAVEAEAKKAKHSERTLTRAKKDVGVVSNKRGTQWLWSLPIENSPKTPSAGAPRGS